MTADLQTSPYPGVRSEFLVERRSWVLLMTEIGRISGTDVRRTVCRMRLCGPVEREIDALQVITWRKPRNEGEDESVEKGRRWS